VISFLILTGVMSLYGGLANNKSVKGFVVGAIHGVGQFTLLLLSAITLRKFNKDIFPTLNSELFLDLILFLEIVCSGFSLGGILFGIYFIISGVLFKMHYNEGFSSMQMEGYKNFLRIKIKGDELTVYPVGIKEIPGSRDWVKNPKAKKGSTEPILVSRAKIKAEFIEAPVVINPQKVWKQQLANQALQVGEG
jgi:hypothetical protein